MVRNNKTICKFLSHVRVVSLKVCSGDAQVHEIRGVLGKIGCFESSVLVDREVGV